MERIKVSGLDEFLNDIEKLQTEMPRASRKMMNTLGEVVKGEIKMVTPVDTGELRNKNQFKTISEHEIVVFNNTKYAGHVEYGHRTKNGGYVKGQYFMKRGIENAQPKIHLIVKKTIKEVLNEK